MKSLTEKLQALIDGLTEEERQHLTGHTAVAGRIFDFQTGVVLIATLGYDHLGPETATDKTPFEIRGGKPC